MSSNGWIGVDLDGTLAEYDTWKGIGHIGAPVPAMLARVKQWLAAGTAVKLVTARVCALDQDSSTNEQIERLHDLAEFRQAWAAWCHENGLPVLDVTCAKDFQMLELWDDRAIQVIPNTGIPLLDENTALKRSIADLTREICKFSTQGFWHFVELGLEHIKSEAQKARKSAGLKPYIGV